MHLLTSLTRSGEVSAADAEAWAADAGLRGERQAKHTLAAALELSVRGLDGRLATVDSAIAQVLDRHTPPVARRPNLTERTVAALTVEAVATARQDPYLAAAGHAEATTAARHHGPIRSGGGDRSRRSRALRRARSAIPRIAVLPTLPRLQPLCPGTEIVAVRYALYDDPTAAVAELERAWSDRAVAAYPLLIDHCSTVAPDMARAGAGPRLRLLEIISNILRDTESLLALPAATMWQREAAAALGPLHPQVLAATRTRAHVLQLHGFLDTAAHDLDWVQHMIQHAAYPGEHNRRMELIHTALRRASVEVARQDAANLRWLATLLPRIGAIPEVALHPLFPRLQLHLTVLRGANAPLTAAGRAYENWQRVLVATMATAPLSHPLAILDTMIACALRAKQGTRFIQQLVHQHLPAEPDPAWANLIDRMRQRLVEARTRGHIGAIDIPIPAVAHPLQVAGTLPGSSRYRV